MDAETKKNSELRSKIIDLGWKISGEIEHAECFYDLEMLNDFCSDLDKMKELALEYYNSNRKELDEEE